MFMKNIFTFLFSLLFVSISYGQLRNQVKVSARHALNGQTASSENALSRASVSQKSRYPLTALFDEAAIFEQKNIPDSAGFYYFLALNNLKNGPAKDIKFLKRKGINKKYLIDRIYSRNECSYRRAQ